MREGEETSNTPILKKLRELPGLTRLLLDPLCGGRQEDDNRRVTRSGARKPAAREAESDDDEDIHISDDEVRRAGSTLTP